MFHQPKLIIDLHNSIPLLPEEIKSRYRKLYKSFLENKNKDYFIYIQLGYVYINQKNQIEQMNLKAAFYPISSYLPHDQSFSIERKSFPYNSNLRLACQILIREKPHHQNIAPITPLKPIEFDPIDRPYNSWINNPQKSLSGPFTIEKHWNHLIKLYKYAQKLQYSALKKIDKELKNQKQKQKVKKKQFLFLNKKENGNERSN